VRGELSGKRRRDACVAVVLTGDRGDGGAPIDFIEEGMVLGALSGLRRRQKEGELLGALE
jgi:hypothetical protein